MIIISLSLYRRGEQKWEETIKVTQEVFTVNTLLSKNQQETQSHIHTVLHNLSISSRM